MIPLPGMLQRGTGARFLLETAPAVGIGRPAFRQYLPYPLGFTASTNAG
jgi:hypothetical protein